MNKIAKKLSVVASLALAVMTAFTVVGCGAMGGPGWGGFFPSGKPEIDYDLAEGGAPDDVSGGNNRPYVKQLTAAEWRDVDNYEFWLNLFKKDIPLGDGQGNSQGDNQQNDETQTQNGIFCEYAVATRGLDTFDMHEVSVTCNGDPVVGATVELYSGSDVVYSAVSDSTGKAYVFGDGTIVRASSGDYIVTADVADGTTDVELTNSVECADELEIMLVVDTTGSMGDELSFLCDELAGVVTRVSDALSCNIRLGLTFYRDDGDDYVTREFGFEDVTTQSGLNTVVKNIKAQRSNGGGDYPEAVDTALDKAVKAQWHDGSKTKLLFHVLDAPYHDQQQNQTTFARAVKLAAQKGIRIIPVAASGLDTLGQYIMRSAALLTGGTYTFITDDSGIGDSHELPAVGEFTVEYLSDLMVRLAKGFYTGTFDAPVPWTQSSNVV